MSFLFELAIRRPMIVAEILFEKIFSKQFSNVNFLEDLFADKTGIEIGGPSNFFSAGGFLPVYSLAKSVDGCNFSNVTAWEGEIKEGKTYEYAPGKRGHQFICDGVEVPGIPKGQYDFVISCNNLEHIANPLKAIKNWIKLLTNDGTLVLVLPRKESNFDYRRVVTSFEHLMHDYENSTSEDDLFHLEEILKLHDLKLDPLAGNIETFTQRSIANFENRCLHHHVFDLRLLEQICSFFELRVVAKQTRATNHIIIATKTV